MRRVWLRHVTSNRRIPVEVPTVFGRSDHYYEYTDEDIRPGRLRKDVAEGLSALNYVKLCSDDQASRTHGLLDPSEPALCDLNSTNGTFLNEREVPSRDGEAGPLVTVSDGDRVTIGRQTFAVELRDMGQAEIVEEVNKERYGLVAAGAHQSEVAELAEAFLREDKHVNVRRVGSVEELYAGLARLCEVVPENGMAVIILLAECRGYQLRVAGSERAFPELVAQLNSVPGRKVLALAADGDPTACEHYFESEAYEDMVLLTGPQSAMLAGSELITPTLQSRLLLEKGLGEVANPLDGLDALLAETTNILQVAWIDTFRGPLKVTFGSKQRPDDAGLSHSLRLGSSTFRF
ncbi:MAG: FHA domain-containing protein [Planctomycetes bacterium]|nr:FHA domain-containing protein [Planctomycetota bacterium]